MRTTITRAGTGTGGWEAALTNTLSPGDKVITFRYGQFSHLWVDMQQRLGLDVQIIDCPWGDGAHEDKLAEALKAHPDTKAVCVVHNETATGITSDIKKVRETMDAAGTDALLLIDGVSSIGALEFKMDDWRVDVAVTGSQKALSLPTGLSVVCASEKALGKMESAQLRRVYFDFRCACARRLQAPRVHARLATALQSAVVNALMSCAAHSCMHPAPRSLATLAGTSSRPTLAAACLTRPSCRCSTASRSR